MSATHHRIRRWARLARRAVVLGAVVCLALVLGTTAVVGAWLAGVRLPLVSGPTYLEIERFGEARAFGASGEPFFALLIGTDYRPGVPGERGDALQLVGVNPELGAGTIVSIPRDTCVPIPGRGTTKILGAHAAGGPALQAEVVGNLFGVDIAYAFSVDFAGFEAIVNAAGGVVVDIPKAHNDRMSGAFFEPGEQRLNGTQALAMSRNRYNWPSGDLERTQNQGLLVWSGLRQLREEADDPRGRFTLAANLVRHAQLHNFGLRDLMRLAEIAYGIDPDRLGRELLPTRSGGCAGGLTAVPSPEWLADLRADGVIGTG